MRIAALYFLASLAMHAGSTLLAMAQKAVRQK